ncbi:hypothetical protein BD770DRAFT_375807 [Pilaira anomala]|nr:hypothetical protein BD770DRAFT_403474 [Pilaira anomala]KAI9333512.1 hypothetical protein BD770DRAFT_402852 [Pilaira anomala]KAI9337452.1 hypothetical protein BD770DRAFT_401193 [Pilaira anomala]KAI9351699.1 hypothetical protein BD770DRAFT_393913 [Pilaira anomala]KAI9354940.1 hypothetical protein BD770DRAFT_391740 [Pilaira anomala]
MNNQLVNNNNNKHLCDFNECRKEFSTPSALKRHKNSHQPKAPKTRSIRFLDPLTPSNNFVSNNFARIELSPAVIQQEPTVVEVVEPVHVNLNTMVFYEDERPENPDYIDEVEDEDEPLGEHMGFTESTVDEPEDVVDEIEDQAPIVVNGEFFPFRDKIHLLMHQFYYRSGADVSQGLMKDIVKLVEDVVEAKLAYPHAKVPAPDLIFNFNDPRRTKNQIPLLKQTVHDVKVQKTVNGQEVEQTLQFSMNPPSEILKLFVANPSLVDGLSRLPDRTEGELVDSYQSHKWRSHELFQHPMVSVTIHGLLKDIWIGDLVKTDQMMMIVEGFYTLKHSIIMVEGYQVISVQDQFFLHNMPAKTSVPISQVSRIVCDSPETLVLNFESDVLVNSDLLLKCNAIVCKLTRPNPLKRPSSSSSSARKYKPVKVIPLNFFTDDMSGNRTKKHNKFDSWIMVPAALPLAQRHALENTAFICTDHLLSAMQMLPAIVQNLVKLENGVEMFLPSGESVIVVAPLQFITADNARHAEIASSRGAISKNPCRKCDWELKTPARVDGGDFNWRPRSESIVAAMYARYLASGGDKSFLVDTEAGYKLVGGQALVVLKSFDTMLDCPIELLHTIMLGVGKALVKCLLQDHLNPTEKSFLETRLHGYVSKGFSRKLRSSLRLHGSFLGRDYKILVQQVPILLNELIASGEIRSDRGILLIKNCFVDLGKLASLAYISRIKFNSSLYLTQVASNYNDLRLSVLYHDEFLKIKYPNRKGGNIYNSSKMHIMHHLVDDIFRFGSAIFFETEKGEQHNKFVREGLFRTNRQNPSRDVAVAFAKRMMARHILAGGSWFVEGQSIPLKASRKVLECASSVDTTVRDFADNNDQDPVVKLGSSGIFKNKHGNYLIGEVVKVDALTGEYKVVEYALLRGDEAITRFDELESDDVSSSLYHTCMKDGANNLLVFKTRAETSFREAEGQFVQILDISRRYNNYNLINISKFGTFWWALSHKKKIFFEMCVNL